METIQMPKLVRQQHTENDQDHVVLAPPGYGNHSCQACCSRFACPISNRSSTPNQCTFYWPPNTPPPANQWYWDGLQRIAQQRKD